MKRITFFCCLALLLSLFCSAGWAESISTPTDLCGHTHHTWKAQDDSCICTCADCGLILDKSWHSGSCTNKAQCMRCGAGIDGTQWVHTAPTYTILGPEGHRQDCSACGSSLTFSHTATCTAATTCMTCGYAGPIDTVWHEYDYGNTIYDSAGHHTACNACGDVVFEKHWSRTGTCGSGSKCASASCPFVFPDEHSWAAIYLDENTHGYVCSVCDLEGDTQNAHLASCANPSQCLSCGYVGDMPLTHTISTLSDGASGHHEACLSCDYAGEQEWHTAPCTSPDQCEICGYTGEIDIIWHTDASYTSNGPADHTWRCAGCGAAETSLHRAPCDDPTHCILCEYAGPIEELTHTWEITDSAASTCVEKGFTAYLCNICGETMKEVYHLKAHTYATPTPNGDGTHTQVCSHCANTAAAACAMVNARFGPLDMSSCIHCGYITRTEDGATVSHEGTAIASAAFALTDGRSSSITLVAYESPIQLAGNRITIKKVLTLALLDDGSPLTPEEAVKLTIPMEDDLTGLKLLVMDENGELVEIRYEVVDGMMVFETNVLGIFMLVEEI